MIDFDSFDFVPVVKLPNEYHIFDMTNGPMVMPKGQLYGVGKYNEYRPDVYMTEQFAGTREHHIGIDIFGPEHVHIQLSYQRPTICDMPGVVSKEDLPEMLSIHPDPQRILGRLY